MPAELKVIHNTQFSGQHMHSVLACDPISPLSCILYLHQQLPGHRLHQQHNAGGVAEEGHEELNGLWCCGHLHAHATYNHNSAQHTAVD